MNEDMKTVIHGCITILIRKVTCAKFVRYFIKCQVQNLVEVGGHGCIISFSLKISLSLCQWFTDNQLSIHFEEDKTKSILLSKTRCLQEFNISFAGHSIKQYETVDYLGCQLDSKLSGEAKASKVLQK